MENIKKLRDITGAGMMDCKKALVEAENNIEKAVELLRKKGITKAAKRGDRETKQGIVKVATSDDKKEGYILEINAETDFVVRNEKFQDLVNKIFEVVKTEKPADKEALLALSLGGETVREVVEGLSGIIGEKLDIKRCAVLTSEGTVASYSHANGAIGVLVALNQAGKDELAEGLAMHTAAANPEYLTSDEVPAEEIEKEKDVYRAQLKKEGKPENMIEKILQGKVNKYFEGICLVNQEYIKDDKKKIKDILDGSTIEKFIRFSLQ